MGDPPMTLHQLHSCYMQRPFVPGFLLGLSFVSVAAIKYPSKTNFEVKGAYFGFDLSLQGSHGRSLKMCLSCSALSYICTSRAQT